MRVIAVLLAAGVAELRIDVDPSRELLGELQVILVACSL